MSANSFVYCEVETMVFFQETETVNACLEVLDELVSKLGNVLEPEHQTIKEALLRLLQANKASNRKRILHCLGDSSCSQ